MSPPFSHLPLRCDSWSDPPGARLQISADREHARISPGQPPKPFRILRGSADSCGQRSRSDGSSSEQPEAPALEEVRPGMSN